MWFQKEAYKISRQDMLMLTRRFADEARKRISYHPRP